MHWAGLIVIAGILNAIVNFGYKVKAVQEGIFLYAGCVVGISSITLLCLHFATTKSAKFSALTTGLTPFVILGMGVGSALIMYLFVSALAKGPYSIIDPLLACVYTLTSVVIGLVIIRENPSMLSLIGVALYVVAVILMSRAQSH